MSALPQSAAPSGPVDSADSDLGLADIVDESMLMLGAGSTVLYQLALLGVGRGVAEHSTTLTRPVDRLRTTLTYVYAMTYGTEEERTAVARMVNKAHSTVRGKGYTAYDRDLQLWVAATLAYNGGFIYEKVYGPLSEATKERLYRDSWIFGTALQVREEDWPATRPAFEEYWDHMVSTQLSSEPLVQDYVRKLLSAKGQPWFARPLSGLQSLVTRGNLPPEVREVLALSWSWREQKLYDLFWSVHNVVYPFVPAFLRKAHARIVMRDFRRRMRKGLRVI
jgi:uncharacterized protein (DUF2236 family)